MGIKSPETLRKEVTVDSWSEKDQKIEVQEGENGFLYNLKLRGKVGCSPSLVYSILTDPNSVSIFRSIKACTYRKILEQDKSKGTRKVEVWHRAIAKFLFLSITFETQLFVWEDDRNKTIRFCAAREGMMKKFEGSWRVQPFTTEAINGKATHHHNPLVTLQHKLGMHHHHGDAASSSLVTLEQAILPKATPPPGMRGMLRRMCGKQIKDMLEDLRTEVDKREGYGANKQATGSGVIASHPVACLTSAHSDVWESAIQLTIQI